MLNPELNESRTRLPPSPTNANLDNTRDKDLKTTSNLWSTLARYSKKVKIFVEEHRQFFYRNVFNIRDGPDYQRALKAAMKSIYSMYFNSPYQTKPMFRENMPATCDFQDSNKFVEFYESFMEEDANNETGFKDTKRKIGAAKQSRGPSHEAAPPRRVSPETGHPRRASPEARPSGRISPQAGCSRKLSPEPSKRKPSAEEHLEPAKKSKDAEEDLEIQAVNPKEIITEFATAFLKKVSEEATQKGMEKAKILELEKANKEMAEREQELKAKYDQLVESEAVAKDKWSRYKNISIDLEEERKILEEKVAKLEESKQATNVNSQEIKRLKNEIIQEYERKRNKRKESHKRDQKSSKKEKKQPALSSSSSSSSSEEEEETQSKDLPQAPASEDAKDGRN